MFQSKDPQALEVCPYNSAHRILKYRMAIHIAKCKKQYEESMSMSECIFNATHSIPTEQLQHHLENCPDRFNLDKTMFVSTTVDQKRFPIAQLNVDNEENWDDERPRGTYNPEEYCKKNAILRQSKVESAATRKHFRMEERIRIQRLKEMEPCNTVQKSHAVPSKFRSQALANTITNVEESDPYTQETLVQIIQNRSVMKPTTFGPGVNPTFVKPSFEKTEEKENKIDDKLATSGSSSSLSSSSLTSPVQNTGAVKKQDADGFMQQSRRKIGKGRGRGVSH